jgi:hypothetical protein
MLSLAIFLTDPGMNEPRGRSGVDGAYILAGLVCDLRAHSRQLAGGDRLALWRSIPAARSQATAASSKAFRRPPAKEGYILMVMFATWMWSFGARDPPEPPKHRVILHWHI